MNVGPLNIGKPVGVFRKFYVKRLPDGKALINLGCGTHMHPGWNNLDYSVYARLRTHMWLVSILKQVGLISPDRYAQFTKVVRDIISWDLSRGIPFGDETFDVLYHSHFLEHIDREDALYFMAECYRVLKPGGVIRVVVPDLEKWAKAYSQSLSLRADDNCMEVHGQIVADLLTQLVQREPTTRKMQKPVVRWLERVWLGDSRKAGWQHRWMYDKYSLKSLLLKVGFKDIRVENAFVSRVEGWSKFNLDTREDDTIYKPESIYVEGVK